MRLTGARRGVLTAVLGLLCGWSRITDDAIRLPQIVDHIVAAGGRRYDLKTVGRALGGLAEAGLITYVPACGRGRCAQIAIHPSLTADIDTLGRDAEGKVITGSVTFSGPDSSYRPNNYPPTPLHPQRSADKRPTGVNVHPGEVRQILAEMPAVFRDLPMHLRWRLGREIRSRLAAGFTPSQILAVLAAPLPPEVDKPWRLARWRLARNMVGAGPRLAPLQQQWDRRQAENDRQAAHASTVRWHSAVTEVTTPAMRTRLLDALQARFGIAIADSEQALAHVGRIATREFGPGELAQALTDWLAAWTPQPVVADDDPRDETPTADGIGDHHNDEQMCVACQAAPGQVRDELPLRSAVCQPCWLQLADPELLTEADIAGGAL